MATVRAPRTLSWPPQRSRGSSPGGSKPGPRRARRRLLRLDRERGWRAGCDVRGPMGIRGIRPMRRSRSWPWASGGRAGAAGASGERRVLMTLAVRSVCSCLSAEGWTLVFPRDGTSFRVADDLGNGWFPFCLLALRAGGGGLLLPLPSRVMRWPMILKRNWCAAIGLGAGRWSFSVGAEYRLAAAPWLGTSKPRMLQTWWLPSRS